MMFAELKNRILKYLLPVLAIAGILISVELTVVYFNANFVPGSAPSICSVNEVVDCDSVAKSQFSAFFGIPLSVYGILFYTAILILSVIQFFNTGFFEKFKNPKSYIFSLATLSLIISAILALISATQIHKICIFCYVTYFINLAIFCASKVGYSYMQHYENTIKEGIDILSVPVFKYSAIFLAIVAGFGLYFFNISGISLPANPFLQGFKGSNYSQIPSGNLLGSRNPKLVINEYTDFECPYCAISNLMMHRLVKELPQVQVIHHDFPLGQCNPKINNTDHKYSCLAALYVRAAEKQGKKWALMDLLFENQQDLPEKRILELAKTLKLDITRLKKDAHDPAASKQLKADINRAFALGIEGTPIYIIGMKKHEGLMPYPELKEMVLQNLK